MASNEPQGKTFVAARRISDVGNAMTFGLLAGVVFSFFTPQVVPSWAVFLLAFASMIFAPGAVLVYGMKVKGIDFDFTDRATRTPWYLGVEACYASGMVLFSPLLLPSWPVFCLAVVSTLLNGAMLLINLKWKISAHAAGAAGPATGICIVFGWWTLLVMGPVVAAVAWSRHVLGKHTPLQLVSGTVLAIACYALVFLGLYPLFAWG